MSDLLQENLMYLMHNKKDMFSQIQNYLELNEEKNCKIINRENGTVNLSYTLQEGTKLLYAEDGSDVDKWISDYEHLRNGRYDVVMYGLGLTHHLARMIELNSLLNFYIIEPEIDIFLESLKVINLEQLLQHPQVKLLNLGNSEKEFNTFHFLLNTYSIYEKKDVFIPFYVEINFDSVSAYYDSNYAIREARLIGKGFEKVFGTQPYRNSIRNIEKMCRSRSIEVLKNKFEGCTALIIGAGPSLELDIEHIKQNREKLLIYSSRYEYSISYALWIGASLGSIYGSGRSNWKSI